MMSKSIGIWIDHEKAFVVTLREGREDVMRIESNVEGRVRLPGGGPTLVVPEGRPEHRHTQHLRLFYRDVAETVKDAARLYIFGPGEAKGEFVKELRKSKALATRIAAIETADKMTERQMAAKVRSFFAKSGENTRKCEGRR
ncbi:MAG: hypothetical protein ISS31_06660 [Kiritimatiellae bacterium]|nr:hypothetical protein [Kiritimatiellia bacterium]